MSQLLRAAGDFRVRKRQTERARHDRCCICGVDLITVISIVLL